MQGNHKVPCGFGKKTRPCTWEMVGFDSADVHGTGSWGHLCLCAGTPWVPQVLGAGLHGRAEASGAAWSSLSPAVGTSPRRGGLLTSWQRKGNTRPRSHRSCCWALTHLHQVTSEHTAAPGQTARSHVCQSPSHLASKWGLRFIFYEIARQVSERPWGRFTFISTCFESVWPLSFPLKHKMMQNGPWIAVADQSRGQLTHCPHPERGCWWLSEERVPEAGRRMPGLRVLRKCKGNSR